MLYIFMIYILFHLFPHVFMDHVEIYLEQLEFPVLLPSLVPHQLPVIHIALWNGRCGRRYISTDTHPGPRPLARPPAWPRQTDAVA